MKTLSLCTRVKGNYQSVFAEFDKALFKKLQPPGLKVDLLRFDEMLPGGEVHLGIHLLGKVINWVSIITESQCNKEKCFFVDEGKFLPFPLIYWRHVHEVIKVDEDTCTIRDFITFKASKGWSTVIYPMIWSQMALRKPIYKKNFGKI